MIAVLALIKLFTSVASCTSYVSECYRTGGREGGRKREGRREGRGGKEGGRKEELREGGLREGG